MKYLLFVVLLSVAVSSFADLCDQQPGPGSTSKCLDCTTNQLSSGQCGWCAPTLQCLKGNSSGPVNATCNVGWYFLIPGQIPVSTCPTCGLSRSCLQCNQNPDCAWCGSNSTCYSLDAMPPTCMAVHDAGCPCEERTQCSDCANGPSCVFCGAPQFQCVSLSSSSVCEDRDKMDDCSCNDFTDCNTCQEQEPCFWCAKSNKCQFYNETSCAPTLRFCPAHGGGFSASSYFGGIFTVVGVVAVAGIGYFAYKYLQEQRAGYEPIST